MMIAPTIDLAHLAVNPAGLVGCWDTRTGGVPVGGTWKNLANGAFAATVAGGAAVTAEGLDMDGIDGHANIGALPVYLTSNWTVSYWINAPAQAAGTRPAVSLHVGVNDFLYLGMSTSSARAWGKTANVQQVSMSTTASISGAWHHCCWVRSGGDLSLVLDADTVTEWAVNTSGGTLPAGYPSAVYFGYRNPAGLTYLDAILADPLIFARELSLAESRALYDSQKWRHR